MYSVEITDAEGNTVTAETTLLLALPDCSPAIMGLDERVTAQFDESIDSLTVNLTDRSTLRSLGCAIIEEELAEDAPNVRRVWYFGDGTAAEGKTVTHNYTEPGTYTLRLEVTVDDYTAEVSRDITVRDLDVPVPD